MEEEALAFIGEVLKTKVTGSFHEALKTGVVLCDFINALKPGSAKAPNKSSKMAFICMENIESYTKACRAIGIPDDYNFVSVDLWEQRNLKQVASNIVAVKRHFGHGFHRAPSALVDVATGTDQTTSAASRASSIKPISEGCVECNRAITAGVVEIPLSNGTTAVYHVACFKCKKCGVAINKSNYKLAANLPYCDRCDLILKSPVKGPVGVKVADKGFAFK